jgi:hypothetical protein
MESVFPEARNALVDADPEIAALVQEEKRRQWCAHHHGIHFGRSRSCGDILTEWILCQPSFVLPFSGTPAAATFECADVTPRVTSR